MRNKFFRGLLTCAVSAAILLLSGCETTPPPTTEPTTLPPKTTKTVYVHTSVTQSSENMDVHTEYIYDENDLLKEVVQYSGTIQTLRYTVTTDENGNFTQWDSTVGGTALSVHFSYDQQGRSTGTTHYQNGELMTQLSYTFEGDLRTSMVSAMPAQNSESRTEYIYNSQGTLVRQDQFLNGTLTRYGICAVDQQQRLTQIYFYLPDGTRDSSAAYSYDGLTESCTLSRNDGSVISKTVTVRDSAGNLLESSVYDSADRLISSETHTWKAIEVPLSCPRASM